MGAIRGKEACRRRDQTGAKKDDTGEESQGISRSPSAGRGFPGKPKRNRNTRMEPNTPGIQRGASPDVRGEGRSDVHNREVNLFR